MVGIHTIVSFFGSRPTFQVRLSVSFREWVCLRRHAFVWIFLKQLSLGLKWCFFFVRWLNMSFHQWIYSCTLMWFLIEEGTHLSSFINKRKGIGKMESTTHGIVEWCWMIRQQKGTCHWQFVRWKLKAAKQQGWHIYEEQNPGQE